MDDVSLMVMSVVAKFRQAGHDVRAVSISPDDADALVAEFRDRCVFPSDAVMGMATALGGDHAPVLVLDSVRVMRDPLVPRGVVVRWP